MRELTHKQLTELLDYNPETGHFTWRNYVGKYDKSGMPVGVANGRYSKIRLNGKSYSSHRLAWFYFHGEWPELFVDHINGNKSDNRICNLRLCTPSQNAANAKMKSRNKSGYKGVSWCRLTNKWRACIRAGGKNLSLGHYIDKDEAAAAYARAAITYHGFYAKTE
jgi:hypothetical protein